MVKGLSLWPSDKKLNSILRLPLSFSPRRRDGRAARWPIDPSLHLIIQPALHYPNYYRGVCYLLSSILSISFDILLGSSIGLRVRIILYTLGFI